MKAYRQSRDSAPLHAGWPCARSGDSVAAWARARCMQLCPAFIALPMVQDEPGLVRRSLVKEEVQGLWTKRVSLFSTCSSNSVAAQLKLTALELLRLSLAQLCARLLGLETDTYSLAQYSAMPHNTRLALAGLCGLARVWRMI
jgi:hypothetical protein